MCGIAGEVRYKSPVSSPLLEQMSNGIRHRGPDDDGIWLSPDAHCGFSFRRLAIIDLSPAGHQPMIDSETGNAIVFNGEIYNFQRLRDECKAKGDTFRSLSDTEVILALYRRYGTGCVTRLRGMFAFAIWDAAKQQLFFARDRIGKKPLNYAPTADGIIFCSEIAPLSRHPRVSRAEDPEALELYLHLLDVPAPWTIYKAIRKLPPAHFGVLSRSGFRIEKYWDVDYSPKSNLSDSDALEAFEEKFDEAVRLRMISDVPLGALLSGGVDSSVVVAAMAKASNAPVKTFSAGFEEGEFNELPFANEAARICETEHHPQIVKSDVEALLPTIVKHYGEPYGDPSAIPSFLVCRAAREHVTVVLNGDGGDELLGGYSRYWLAPFKLAASKLLGSMTAPHDLAALTLDFASRPHMPPRILARFIREYVHPELGAANNYWAHWSDSARRSLLADGGDSDLVSGWRSRWLAMSTERAKSPIDRMLYFDNHTYLPDDLMVKMDIASMHCSLEARSPLLDHELIEFCAKLPVNLKVKGGTGKYLLKKLAEKRFGRAFAHRRKMGFGIPQEKWLKGPLRERMKSVLLDRDLMAPFNARTIAATVDEFLRDTSKWSHAQRIWGLLMYGLWRENERDVQLTGPAQPVLADA